MDKFNVHEWNYKRRLTEGNLDNFEEKMDHILSLQYATSDLVEAGVIKPDGLIARSLQKIADTLYKRVEKEKGMKTDPETGELTKI